MKYIIILLLVSTQSFAQVVKIMDSSGYRITLFSNGSRSIIDTNGTFTNSNVLPKSIGLTGVSSASATTGTISVPMITRIVTITPSGACTFNATGGVAGQVCTIVITTSGTTTFILTFGTNFKSTATLLTGILSAKKFAVTFLCLDGTTWIEQSRTAAM